MSEVSYSRPKTGLVLSGGGARAAYQAGVVAGIMEILQADGKFKSFPFPIVTGVSAGAINASFLASHAHDPLGGAAGMQEIWKNISAEQVMRTDIPHFLKTLGQLLMNLALRRFRNPEMLKPPYSLLDASPLRKLLMRAVDFNQLTENLDKNVLDAVAITATDYWNSNCVSFVQSAFNHEQWKRRRRFGVQTRLNVRHILASASIPIFFSPIDIDGRYYGDGSVRNMAPLSPPIHLHAEKLVIVSVKKPVDSIELDRTRTLPPSPAKVLSLILNALMLDQTDFDMERLMRINATLKSVNSGGVSSLQLKPIDYLWIQPSEDLGELAKEYAKGLPRMLKWVLKPLGSLEQATEIVSYLLFDSAYCTRLIDIGKADARRRKQEILNFFSLQSR